MSLFRARRHQLGLRSKTSTTTKTATARGRRLEDAAHAGPGLRPYATTDQSVHRRPCSHSMQYQVASHSPRSQAALRNRVVGMPRVWQKAPTAFPRHQDRHSSQQIARAVLRFSKRESIILLGRRGAAWPVAAGAAGPGASGGGVASRWLWGLWPLAVLDRSPRKMSRSSSSRNVLSSSSPSLGPPQELAAVPPSTAAFDNTVGASCI